MFHACSEADRKKKGHNEAKAIEESGQRNRQHACYYPAHAASSFPGNMRSQHPNKAVIWYLY
jgi:hypothetical protein